ncbi:TPA: CDP-glycerol glycerophosphotransferase family protein, partial [Streptococcus pneumoniae]
QGVARNRALEHARGRYVLFLDSDDFIERVTLEVTTTRAENDNSDLVHFDWKTTSLLPERPATFNYFNREPYWHKPVLEHRECTQLIRMGSYFTVNNLYRREFLNKWRIRYDEEHIYEDIPFMIQVASCAEKVSLVQAPLYVVQQNPTSTTKSGVNTDRHYRGHIHAMKLSFDLLSPRIKYAKEYLVRYHLQKFLVYRQKRVPARYRKAYTRDFVEVLHAVQPSLPEGVALGGILAFCLEREVFARKRVALLGLLAVALDSYGPRAKKLASRYRALVSLKSDGKLNLASVRGVVNPPASPQIPNVRRNHIVFLGFDWKYTGNSKALFEQMRSDARFDGRKLSFITADREVPSEFRLKPGSAEAIHAIGSAEILIAESWIPGWAKKNPESIWIQLWHGTPFKKVLFDSVEPAIVAKQPLHKINKYQDTLRWDFLVVDSDAAAEKFQTAFLFPESRMIRSGYPRVKYLQEASSARDSLALVKERARIPRHLQNRKVVLYAPTWRDYNYGVPASKKNFRYKLDLSFFAKALGDDYVVLFHDHSYMKTQASKLGPNCVDVSASDIQELLLVTDVLVSDYSSVIFDAVSIGLPFVLYTSDQASFEKSRGVYPDIRSDLYSYSAGSLD